MWQTSEPYCIHLEVPAPQIRFVDPTPAQDSTVVTYIGCPFSLVISSEDENNHFDLEIEPWEVRVGSRQVVVRTNVRARGAGKRDEQPALLIDNSQMN